MTPIEYFNLNSRGKHWSKNENTYKRWFRKQLKHLLVEIEDESTERELASFMWRLGLGYWGIGRQYGLVSGIKTKDSLTNSYTNDHVFGTVEMGKYIHQEFKRNNFDIDYMVNQWLYDNLWLWMTIKVSKKEHKKDNIQRNSHSLDEKKDLKHYKNVSELIFS